MSDQENKKLDPEEIRFCKGTIAQEFFWFTGTTVAFNGAVATFLPALNIGYTVVCSILVATLGVFTVYLISTRHIAFQELNGKQKGPFWHTLKDICNDKSGSLYACSVIILTTLFSIVAMIARSIEKACH